jgi:hypothetical protein
LASCRSEGALTEDPNILVYVVGPLQGGCIYPATLACFSRIDLRWPPIHSDGEVDQINVLVIWLNVLQQDTHGLMQHFDGSPYLTAIDRFDKSYRETALFKDFPKGRLLRKFAGMNVSPWREPCLYLIVPQQENVFISNDEGCRCEVSGYGRFGHRSSVFGSSTSSFWVRKR